MSSTVKFASMYYLLISAIPLLFVFDGILAVIPFAMFLTFFRMGLSRAITIIAISVVFFYSIYYQLNLVSIREAGILMGIALILGIISYLVYSRFYELVNLLFAGALFGYILPRGGGAMAALATALIVGWLKPGSYVLFIIFASLFFASFHFVKFAIRYYQKPDPRKVAIDEVLGMLILLIFIPCQLTYALVGWVLFEILDIFKIFPVNIFDRVKGEGGVILDDIVAGVMGGMLWMLAEYYLPWL